MGRADAQLEETLGGADAQTEVLEVGRSRRLHARGPLAHWRLTRSVTDPSCGLRWQEVIIVDAIIIIITVKARLGQPQEPGADAARTETSDFCLNNVQHRRVSLNSSTRQAASGDNGKTSKKK